MSTPSSPRSLSLSRNSFSYAIGTILQVGGTVFRINEIKDFFYGVENLENHEKKVVPFADLIRLRPGIDVTVVQNAGEGLEAVLARTQAERKAIRSLPTDGKSPATIASFLEKKRWLDALHDRGYHDFKESQLDVLVLRYISERHSLPLRSAETLAQWEQRSLRDGALLLPNFSARGGKGQSRGNPRSDELLALAILDVRDGNAARTVQGVKDMIDERVKNASLTDPAFEPPILPSDSTIYRRLQSQLTPFERAAARVGLARAHRMFRGTAAREKVSEPGLVYEFDDTDTRVFCLDDSGLPWGRAWATLGTDQASGFPVGMNMDTIPLS